MGSSVRTAVYAGRTKIFSKFFSRIWPRETSLLWATVKSLRWSMVCTHHSHTTYSQYVSPGVVCAGRRAANKACELDCVYTPLRLTV